MRANFARRTVLAVGLALALIGEFAGTAGAAANADDRLYLDTVKAWNGGDSVQPFRPDGSQTYGQTITAPRDISHLSAFTFVVKLPPSTRFRAYLYAWDGSASALHAVGPALWASRSRTTDSESWTFEKYYVNRDLVPGEHYVVFLTTLGLSQPITSADDGLFAFPDHPDLYSGGRFVYFFNDRFRKLTTTTWDGGHGFAGSAMDLAFKAKFVSS